MSGVLGKIVASKEAEVAELRHQPRSRGTSGAPATRRPIDVVAALRRPVGAPLRLITEHKRRSPSAGALSTVLSPADRGLAYARNGASMISVLCDAPFFDGSWEHLATIRRALDDAGLPVPLLAKEFVIDQVQLEVAREKGADAVLLIARIVDARKLAELVAASRAVGLEPLVEVVSDEELAAALAASATVIGVNARDLDTLVMDVERAARLLAAIPPSCVAAHLSGLKSPDDVARVATSGVDAALMGEALMREDDPANLLTAMVRRANSPKA
ncbi:Indole-3-glycerol phosphate synthase [Labilithrix luteola]|uniref:indole-3-glycerol-phosphate synthase n=1 Tax=Labilithrix luteola TaxID=1391654 RepID=A0A0K1Q9S6_9BACT|nr:indole-3-glycerol phosphate synthase TrpC [Labilithrix luteola]AKV02417.1 Indole-3-glycerol phosphate synthase [Labilithrix luteola]